LADGILAGKQLVCKDLIDNYNARRRGGLIAEIAAVGEMDAESIEVAGSGHVELDSGGGVERLSADGLKAVGTVSTGKRKRVGDGGGRDSGNGSDAALKFREKLYGALGRIAVKARIDGNGEDAGGTETNINAGGGAQAAQAKAGNTKKHKRHGDLRDDEEVAERPETAGAREEVFAFESRGSEAPGGGPGGEKAEENASNQAEDESKGEDFGVDANTEIDRDRNGEAEGGESAGGPNGDENAERATKKREQRAFGKDLAKELEARGTESHADGHFALASRSFREEKIGDIGAGDKKDKEDNEHESGEEKKDD